MSESKKKKKSMMGAATLVTVLGLAATVLGFVRSIVMSSMFGLGKDLDAYNAAFTIPDFIYQILVGGALSTALIPIFSGYIANGEEDGEGRRMANSVLNLVIVFAIVLCLLGEFFTPQIMHLLVQFDGETFDLSIQMTRIMFFQCFFMCLTGVAMGLLQSYKSFVPSSVGSALYNVVIILGGLFFSIYFNWGIVGFAISVVLASLVNLLCHIGPLFKEGYRYQFIFEWKNPGVQQFFRLLGPTMLGLSVNYINQVVNQYFASGLESSTLSAMKNSQSIMNLPVTTFAGTVAIMFFPTMSEHFAKGEISEFKKVPSDGFRIIFFILIPCSVGVMVLRVPIVRALFMQGNFTEDNVSSMAIFLLFYGLGIIGYSERLHLSRGFYSLKDMKTPVIINVIILIVNAVCSAVFVKLWKTAGLALAYSVAGNLSMILQYVLLRKKIGKFETGGVFVSAIKTLISATVMGVVIYFADGLFVKLLPPVGKIAQFTELALMVGLGILVFAAMALLLRMQEAKDVIGMIKRKLHRA